MKYVGPSGGSQQSGGNIFFAKYGGPSSGSLLSGGGIIILRVIRRHFLVCGRGPSCQPLHVLSTSDGSELTAGETFFSRNTVARRVGPSSQGQTFFHEILVARPVGPCCQVEE